ncbi:MAG TPA: YdcF family protein [Desulfopila sp.]|nr:YdcF family protein [Desulfopila sp.]
MGILKLPFKIFLFVSLLFLLVATAQLLFYAYLQSTSSLPQRSELIIVFPGEKERIEAALQLVDIGLGEHLAVINKTKKQLKNEVKEKNGSKKAVLLTGKESRSTFEDVYRAVQLIRKHKLHTVTLVTASYHMPRALFLFKTHLFGSGLNVELRHLSVEIAREPSLSTLSGLFYDEAVKMWGSTVELVGNQATGRLMYDLPWFQSISKLAHRFILNKG